MVLNHIVIIEVIRCFLCYGAELLDGIVCPLCVGRSQSFARDLKADVLQELVLLIGKGFHN